jgi:hypothetical protein
MVGINFSNVSFHFMILALFIHSLGNYYAEILINMFVGHHVRSY